MAQRQAKRQKLHTGVSTPGARLARVPETVTEYSCTNEYAQKFIKEYGNHVEALNSGFVPRCRAARPAGEGTPTTPGDEQLAGDAIPDETEHRAAGKHQEVGEEEQEAQNAEHEHSGPTADRPIAEATTLPHFKFQLLPTIPSQIGQISEHELSQCFDLVQSTSHADYIASSRGWNPVDKKTEMRHPDTWYILVQGRYGSDPWYVPRSVHQTTRDEDEGEDEGEANSESEKETSANPPAIDRKTETPPPRTLGFLSFRFDQDDPPHSARPVGYIYEIHLSAHLRGLGLGSYLIQQVERMVASTGTEKVMLTVFVRNGGARRLYRRLGFERDECSPPGVEVREKRLRGRRVERVVRRGDYEILSRWVGGVGEGTGEGREDGGKGGGEEMEWVLLENGEGWAPRGR